MSRKLIGIRRRRQGWRATVRVGGTLYSKQFPLDTPIAAMRAWREQQIDRFGGPAGGSFAADVAEYLTRVAAMPSYPQRAAHLELWLAALGRDRPRRTITPAEIDRVLQTWLRTLSPVTVRKRRTALQSLFVTLDGPVAPNPVRASANPKAPPPEPRGIDYVTIARILAAMPTQQAVKPGAVPRPALGKVRVTVLAYTGMPPCALQHLTPPDVDFATATVRLVARRKGRGAAARTVPLTVEGLEALRAFHAAQAYGAFATEALNRSFKRAAARVGADPRVRLYDLRHSFGCELYRLTRDLATVARFLGHAPGSSITARYAQGANTAVDVAAAAAFSAARAAERAGVPSAEPLPASPKPRSRKALRRAS
jgi:integrase